MSSIELLLAPGINRRRREISAIDARLQELNASFPGERKKPNAERDPNYSVQRTAILDRRRLLSGEQHIKRGQLAFPRRPGI